MNNELYHKAAVKCGNGDCYVYVWFDSDDKPFYVGMGRGDRCEEVDERYRSKEFEKMYNKGGCYVKIMLYGMKAYEAKMAEKGMILAYREKGANLVNIQHLISNVHDENSNVRRRYWIVDGEIKLAEEWCSIYGISYSAVYSRMKKGLTLKEALTYPKVSTKAKPRIKAAELWDELGLKAGTDLSALDVGNCTKIEINNIESRLSLGKTLFGNRLTALYLFLQP